MGLTNGTFTSTTGTGSSPTAMLRGFDAVMASAEPYAGSDKPGDAAAYMQTGWQYIQYGEQTATMLSEQLVRRGERLKRLEAAGADPKLIEKQREQVDLLTQLRDRILESVQRVREIMLRRTKREEDERAEQETLARVRASAPAPVAAPAGAATSRASDGVSRVAPTVEAVAQRYRVR